MQVVCAYIVKVWGHDVKVCDYVVKVRGHDRCKNLQPWCKTLWTWCKSFRPWRKSLGLCHSIRRPNDKVRGQSVQVSGHVIVLGHLFKEEEEEEEKKENWRVISEEEVEIWVLMIPAKFLRWFWFWRSYFEEGRAICNHKFPIFSLF